MKKQIEKKISFKKRSIADLQENKNALNLIGGLKTIGIFNCNLLSDGPSHTSI